MIIDFGRLCPPDVLPEADNEYRHVTSLIYDRDLNQAVLQACEDHGLRWSSGAVATKRPGTWPSNSQIGQIDFWVDKHGNYDMCASQWITMPTIPARIPGIYPHNYLLEEVVEAEPMVIRVSLDAESLF